MPLRARVEPLSSRSDEDKRGEIGDTEDCFYGDDQSDYSSTADLEETRGYIKHHSTDVPCLIVFLIAVAFFIYVYCYGIVHGNYTRLFRGYNYEGKLCGYDTPDSYLFWCSKSMMGGEPTELDLTHPICVATCPSSSDEMYACPSSEQGDTVMRQAYPTYKYLDRYCIPSNEDVVKTIMDHLNSNPAIKWAMEVAQIPNAWWLLVLVALGAFATSYLYFCLVALFAGPLVWAAMVCLCVIPSVSGSYLIFCWQHGGAFPHTGDAQWDFIVGCSLLALGAFFIFICTWKASSVDTAIACVQAGVDCIFDLPSLLLEPLFTSAMKGLVMSVMIAGFLLLCSCGELQAHTGYFTFEYTDYQWKLILYYIFMMLWIAELFNALSNFVVSYAVQLWYFTPFVDGEKEDVPSFCLGRGYAAGLTFHTGTLAFGALVIAICRFTRLILGAAAKASQDTGNCVGACIAKIILCLVTCFQRFVEFVNKNAYMECAISSNTFCRSAFRAMLIIAQEVTAVSVLNGACWIIQLAGLGTITAIGGVTFFISVTHLSWFSDKFSDHYIPDPVFLAIVSALISFLVAYPMMLVFDQVCDTILFCFATEKRWNRIHSMAQKMEDTPKKKSSISRIFTSQSIESEDLLSHEELDDSCEPIINISSNVQYAPPALHSIIERYSQGDVKMFATTSEPVHS